MEQKFEQKYIDEAKGLVWLSYIGLLLLIPFLMQKENPYTKYHVKQGIGLVIFAVAIAFVGWIPILGWLIALVGFPLELVLMAIGIFNSLTGKAKPLPIIGPIGDSLKF